MSDNTRPVWLLDVDGVINVDEPQWANVARDTALADGASYPMCWAPGLIDCIRILHTMSVIEVRWCTTWCDYTSELDRLWAIPNVTPSFTSVSPRRASYAKRMAANCVVTHERRPLIWTDDNVVPIHGDPLYDELTVNGRGLLIRPNDRHGLTPTHISEIMAFAYQFTSHDGCDG